jgi:hypothetical protein
LTKCRRSGLYSDEYPDKNAAADQRAVTTIEAARYRLWVQTDLDGEARSNHNHHQIS